MENTMACKTSQVNNNEKFSNTITKQLSVSLKRIELNISEEVYANNKLPRNLESSVAKLTVQCSETTKKNSECDNQQKYTCNYPECNKNFGKLSRLTVHIRTHTGERPFQCKYEHCNKSYTRQFHLTRHLSVSHGSIQQVSEATLRCDKCEKDFTNAYSLKKHESRIHNEERYKCKECEQIFKKQQHLKSHSFVHTGIKPYKCNYPGCSSRFTVPSKLKRHSLSHSAERYICCYETCKEKFDRYSNLRDHLTSSHPKRCDICGKEFNMLCRLKEHLISHQEIRESYFCPFTPCERYYLEEKNLKNHVHLAHNKDFDGFACPLCSKRLITKQKLKLHMKVHNPNKLPQGNKNKTRKPRKDKGTSKTDYAQLLSGYKPAEHNSDYVIDILNDGNSRCSGGSMPDDDDSGSILLNQNEGI